MEDTKDQKNIYPNYNVFYCNNEVIQEKYKTQEDI